MPNRTETTIGHLILKNPIIAGSGEATMTEGGIRAALEKGAGAVISKSTNESPAAKQQLNHTDYMLFDSRWRPIKWTANPPEDAQLFWHREEGDRMADARSLDQDVRFSSWLQLAG